MKEWADGLQREVLVRAGVDLPRRRRSTCASHRPGAGVLHHGVRGPGRLPAHYAFRGPAIGDRPDGTPFPWEWLDRPGPHVLVSLGTLNWHNGGRFFRGRRGHRWHGRPRHRRGPAGAGGGGPAQRPGGAPRAPAGAAAAARRWCATAATTPCARHWPTACRWSWPRSATTSRPSPPRWRRPGRACASCSAGRTGRTAPPWPPPSAIRGCGPAPSGSGGRSQPRAVRRRRLRRAGAPAGHVLRGNRVQHLRPDEVASGGWRSG